MRELRVIDFNLGDFRVRNPKLDIMVVESLLKYLVKQTQHLPRRLKNECLRKISMLEQTLKQMQYNYKHRIKTIDSARLEELILKEIKQTWFINFRLFTYR